MYIPVNELQQYRGQLMCPYCIQDIRDEQRKHDEPNNEKLHMDRLAYPELCQRCNGDLTLGVYYWNGKHLCKRCMEAGQNDWEYVQGGPSKGGQIISATAVTELKVVKKKESLVSNLLHKMGIKKKKEPQIVEIKPSEINKNIEKDIKKEKPKMSAEISLAKPMADEVLTIDLEKNYSASQNHLSQVPVTEGLMKSNHKNPVKHKKTPKK
jgi:hypothetical protein